VASRRHDRRKKNEQGSFNRSFETCEAGKPRLSQPWQFINRPGVELDFGVKDSRF
jgi:hypothetical protein